MPNYVYNTMKVSRNDIKKVFRTSINDNGVSELIVDFNMSVPMPEPLDISCFATSHEPAYYFMSERCTLAVSEVAKKFTNIGLFDVFFDTCGSCSISDIAEQVEFRMRDMTDEVKQDFFQTGKRLIENKLNYGYCDWYSWRLDNWGTKWNAFEYKIVEDECDDNFVVAKFETAWDAPTKWLRTLANNNVTFSLEWIEEQGYHGRIWSEGDGIYQDEELPYIEDVYELIYGKQ